MAYTALQLQDVSKRYQLGEYNLRTLWETVHQRLFRRRHDAAPREVWALRDVGFTVEAGETVGILGRNGAGKSTLLKVIARITYPTRGRIRWRGRVASLLEVGTGFHPELTGRENIFLNGAILGMTRREIRRRLDEIVAFAGVEKFLDTPVKRYSSGMVVRLAFSVAVHLDADILLVDEVLSVGDAFFQRRAIDRMRRLMDEEGRTILFVSHNMAVLRNLCRRGILLEKGRITYDAPIDETVGHYLAQKEKMLAVPLAERTDRAGDGRWRVAAVDFLGPDGRPRSEVLSGDSLRIRITIRKQAADVDPRRLFVGVVLWDAYFHKVAAFFSDEMAASFDFLAHQDAMELTIPSLAVRPGNLTVGVHLGDGGTGPAQLLDYVEEAARLTVLPGDFWHTGRPPRGNAFALLKGRFGPPAS